MRPQECRDHSGRASRSCVFLITETLPGVRNPDVGVPRTETSKMRLDAGTGNLGRPEITEGLKVTNMNLPASTASRVAYGRKLVNAGISGIRQSPRTLDGETVSSLVADSARDSLKLAVAGACLGLLPAWLAGRRPRLSNVIAFGALGSVLGFAAGFTWKTRKVTSSLAHSAARELHRAGDEHWLERHPIDYA